MHLGFEHRQDITNKAAAQNTGLAFYAINREHFFLSLLERVLYFLQITKYQRTDFKKQDYCSGI